MEQIQTFTVFFKKQKHRISFDVNSSVAALKQHLSSIVELPIDLQKIMFKGQIVSDQSSLASCGLSSGSKVMLVGSTYQHLFNQQWSAASVVETKPLSQQEFHSKTVARGLPSSGKMLNSRGYAVRLGFYLESDVFMQITAKDHRTVKVRHHSCVKSVYNEPIHGHEDYHILGIQLGRTQDMIYWIYWVPVHHVDIIKKAIFTPSSRCRTRIVKR